MNAGLLRAAQLARRPPPSALGEWLLAHAFRALCQVMRGAAQFCGVLISDDAPRAGETLDAAAASDLQALGLSGLPLCEIAAAERERIWRVEAARADGPSVDDPNAARHWHVLH